MINFSLQEIELFSEQIWRKKYKYSYGNTIINNGVGKWGGQELRGLELLLI